MIERDRSEGWQWAKLSGHRNEDIATEHVMNDVSLQNRIVSSMHYTGSRIVNIYDGGLHEKSVPCVLGGSTKNKADLHIELDNGKTIDISIKKSLGGQVFLITPPRFIKGYELQFNDPIPPKVKRAIELYWGTADDIEDIVMKYSPSEKIQQYELHYHRVVKDTMDRYDSSLSGLLLEWFDAHMANIVEFCFAAGLVKSKKDWANFIWYVNYVGEENPDLMFSIEDIKNANFPKCYYGAVYGGSTIQLPFGFVQYHDPGHKNNANLQFHHNFDRIRRIIKKI